jgi:uracil-DNA glycosylase
MRWAPAQGHVPRGFCGGTARAEDVRLVLVAAEPGDPHRGETHPQGPPDAALESAWKYAYGCYRDRRDLFHRNIRRILDLCFPGMPFDEQMRITWMTESVLCSAAREGGSVPRTAAAECRRRYLERELSALPNAVIVALGGKAKSRLAGWPGVISAFAASPPGCNFAGAESSWRAAADRVREAGRRTRT